MEDEKQKQQEEEDKDEALLTLKKGLDRIGKVEQVKSAIDTTLDLKDRAVELKGKIDEVSRQSGQSTTSGGSTFWKYAGVAAVAAPLVLWGLNHYFHFAINPVTYYDKIKEQVSSYTNSNITLTGVIGVKDQGSPNQFFYCKITATNLQETATVKGEVTGPGNLQKSFVLTSGVPGTRFGQVGANEFVFEFDASMSKKGQFACVVHEMSDSKNNPIKGAVGTVAILNLQ